MERQVPRTTVEHSEAATLVRATELAELSGRHARRDRHDLLQVIVEPRLGLARLVVGEQYADLVRLHVPEPRALHVVEGRLA